MSTTDIETAVNSLLAPVEEPKAETASQPEPQAEPEEAEIEEQETLEAESEVEETEEANDEAEEDDTAQKQAPSKFTVKVDGKELEVTLDDLKRSYSGQAYIQKGMQEAADAKKQATALYETLQAEQAKFLQVVQTVQQQGFKAPPKAPDIAMMDKDPIGYMQARARYEQDAAEFQAQQTQIQQMTAKQRELQDRALSEYVKEQGKILQERIPEFSDAAKAKEVAVKMRQIGAQAYGFAEQELDSIVDARHVQVLYDAMKWRELQQAKTLQKKAPEAPKNVKPIGRRSEPPQLARKKQIESARKSGRPEAFVDLLLMKP